jgi:hypothetical protein
MDEEKEGRMIAGWEKHRGGPACTSRPATRRRNGEGAVDAEHSSLTPYQQFCLAHGVEHGHCPNHCEKPQPQLRRDRVLVCCWCSSPIVPCTPEICD